MASRFGQMVLNSKASGSRIKPRDSDDSFLQTAMSTRGSGSATRLMERANTSTLKVLLTKEDGTKISKKVMGKKSGRMVLSIMGSTSAGRSTAKEFFSGPMEPNTMATGRTIKCTAQAFSNGPTAGSTRASIITIKSMVKGFTLGQIPGCTPADFITGSSMERDLIGKLAVRKFTVYGRRVRRPKYVKLTRSSKS